ncbi:MAG TPA: hypothetical protein V6C90_23460 [Coleofasciculaceae cyanobacterium]
MRKVLCAIALHTPTNAIAPAIHLSLALHDTASKGELGFMCDRSLEGSPSAIALENLQQGSNPLPTSFQSCVFPRLYKVCKFV